MRIADSVSRLLPGSRPANHEGPSGDDSFATLLQNALRANPRAGAQNLAAAAAPLASTGPDGRLDLDDLRRQADRLLAGLAARLREQLHSAGVDLRQGLGLHIDQQGKLRVDEGHRLAPQIEAALADDPSLAREFEHWATLQAALNAADRDPEFRDAYTRDPRGATSQFSQLVSKLKHELTLRIDADGTRIES
jgi:hypothetical protein